MFHSGYSPPCAASRDPWVAPAAPVVPRGARPERISETPRKRPQRAATNSRGVPCRWRARRKARSEFACTCQSRAEYGFCGVRDGADGRALQRPRGVEAGATQKLGREIDSGRVERAAGGIRSASALVASAHAAAAGADERAHVTLSMFMALIALPATSSSGPRRCGARRSGVVRHRLPRRPGGEDRASLAHWGRLHAAGPTASGACAPDAAGRCGVVRRPGHLLDVHRLGSPCIAAARAALVAALVALAPYGTLDHVPWRRSRPLFHAPRQRCASAAGEVER